MRFQQKGQNIIGILPGVLHGTPADVIALIGAHYDTVEGSPGNYK